MIERVRPDPTPAEVAALYAHYNDANRWAEHRLRVDITVAVARSRFPDPAIVVDPAAGNGETARRIAATDHQVNVDDAPVVVTGDLAPDAPVDWPGTPAVDLLGDFAGEDVDVVVLGEILEHVDDPLALLLPARWAAAGLVVSTPLDEPAGINPEHVWRWDRDGLDALLAAAGWESVDYVEVDVSVDGWPHPCRTQIVTARRAEVLLDVAAAYRLAARLGLDVADEAAT